MSQFYARYVPPAKKITEPASSQQNSSKRKRSGVDTVVKSHPEKKHKRQDTNEKTQTEITQENVAKSARKPRDEILEKYSISGFAKQRGETDVTVRGGRRGHTKEDRHVEQSERTGTQKHGDATDVSDLQHPELSPNDQKPSKHARLLSKFGKSTSKSLSKTQGDRDPEQQAEPILEEHDLAPIPQPLPSTTPAQKPTYSTLLPWQSGAVRADGGALAPFDDLGLSEQTLVNLRKQSIEKAFPVQSTVIPLLLKRGPGLPNDVCVSAATGSGKTLAYAVPIVESLRKQKVRRLRAVIVVPTRELVKQVRETCEQCASGSGLRIVTAAGNKSLKEEQDQLIREETIYNPTEYEKQLNAPIDWTKFDLMAEFEEVQVRPPLLYKGFVAQTRIKADILVTTPGRLVDHLKNTRGFHLDHVEWLVVDEADRLLNESYQEWVETVIPPLKSRNATKQRDQILSTMQLDLPPRVVRKVLLSATMTQDVSKLNALDLRNPKLVIIEPTERSPASGAHQDVNGDDAQVDASGLFHVPPALHETAITFKDGGDKPLVLFKLLTELVEMQIQNSVKNSAYGASNNADNAARTGSESSSETDSGSSSGSDSDSSSDSTSVSADLSSGEETSESESDSDTSSSSDLSNHPITKKKQDQPGPVLGRQASTTSKLTNSLTKSTARALIFTRSTASASRLSRLLTLLQPSAQASSSSPFKISLLTRSTASSASSRRTLSSFQTFQTNILISTDRASRGLDIPGLQHVINYDIPASASNYIHRVGRTARAGRTGHAWTLVEHREGRWFWNEIGGKSHEPKIKRNNENSVVRKRDMKISNDPNDVEDGRLRERYEGALLQLGEEVMGRSGS